MPHQKVKAKRYRKILGVFINWVGEDGTGAALSTPARKRSLEKRKTNHFMRFNHKQSPIQVTRRITQHFILWGGIILTFVGSTPLQAQVDEDQLGAWYMYFWNTSFGDSPWGLQGDKQFRNWNIMGDLEQLLLRGGLTYVPQGTRVKITLGYAYIATGTFGDSKDTRPENRIYQEFLVPQTIGKRLFLTHRYRYEQRWVQGQDMRTRYRYNLFLNLALNRENLKQGAIYLALYNELFINGQRNIGGGYTVQLFDRNRFYSALGYSLTDQLRTQLGYMVQTTNAISKGQLQVSLHHTF
jgi:hypothetical protein